MRPLRADPFLRSGLHHMSRKMLSLFLMRIEQQLSAGDQQHMLRLSQKHHPTPPWRKCGSPSDMPFLCTPLTILELVPQLFFSRFPGVKVKAKPHLANIKLPQERGGTQFWQLFLSKVQATGRIFLWKGGMGQSAHFGFSRFFIFPILSIGKGKGDPFS